jgi:hypothetical protein
MSVDEPPVDAAELLPPDEPPPPDGVEAPAEDEWLESDELFFDADADTDEDPLSPDGADESCSTPGPFELSVDRSTPPAPSASPAWGALRPKSAKARAPAATADPMQSSAFRVVDLRTFVVSVTGSPPGPRMQAS